MYIAKKSIVKNFTLIELLVSMAVFSLLMLALMQFFGSAQKVWLSSSKKTELYGNARIAMDLMTRDLQSIYYKNGEVPFYHYYQGASSDSDRIAFVTYSDLTSSDPNNVSRLAEVQYQLGTDKNGVNWLQVSVVGDTNSNNSNVAGKYNFYSKTEPVFALPTTSTGLDSEFNNVIPYVTDLKFSCYRRGDMADSNLNYISDTSKLAEFPYMVRIDMKLLDKDSWLKWKATGNDDIKNKNELKFSKIVILGDKGQYD